MSILNVKIPVCKPYSSVNGYFSTIIAMETHVLVCKKVT